MQIISTIIIKAVKTLQVFDLNYLEEENIRRRISAIHYTLARMHIVNCMVHPTDISKTDQRNCLEGKFWWKAGCNFNFKKKEALKPHSSLKQVSTAACCNEWCLSQRVIMWRVKFIKENNCIPNNILIVRGPSLKNSEFHNVRHASKDWREMFLSMFKHDMSLLVTKVAWLFLCVLCVCGASMQSWEKDPGSLRNSVVQINGILLGPGFFYCQ